MSTQGALKVVALEKAVINRPAGKSGSGLFVKNPKSNVEIVKTGILLRFQTMSFEIT